MKKYIILTIAVAFILGMALDPVKQFVLNKFNYHPASVVLTYVVALLIGIPVLLWLNKLKANK